MLKGIKETILKNASEESEAALCKTKNELEAELKKTKGEGIALVTRAEKEAMQIIENERRERLSWAKLETKRIIAGAKEDALNIAFEDLFSKVKSYADTKEFAEKMKRKISLAIKEIGGNTIVHLKKGEKKLFLKGNVRKDVEIIGGAIVESKDGRVKLNLSIESFLDAQKDMLRKKIYEKMFETK